MSGRTLILYHATNAKHLPTILRDGILPRAQTGNGNYEGKVKSKPTFVYLTNRAPAFYGYQACRSAEESFSILKVEVDAEDLFPDEDFVALCLEEGDGGNREELIHATDPWHHKELWKESLALMGNVCLPKVSPQQILTHETLPVRDYPLLTHLGIDFNTQALLSEEQFARVGGDIRKNMERLFLMGWERLKAELETE